LTSVTDGTVWYVIWLGRALSEVPHHTERWLVLLYIFIVGVHKKSFITHIQAMKL